MNTKSSNLLEDMAKYIILQNDDIRHANSITSKSLFLNHFYSLMNQRTCYNNITMFTFANMLPYSSIEERNSIIGLCRQKSNECDSVLSELLFNTLKDKIISMCAERNVRGYR